MCASSIVPPAQMFRNLQAGTIDGFCAGEPWNSLAVRAGVGWCPTWSAAQAPGHVEKVLMVTERFAETRAAEHAALISALVVPRQSGATSRQYRGPRRSCSAGGPISIFQLAPSRRRCAAIRLRARPDRTSARLPDVSSRRRQRPVVGKSGGPTDANSPPPAFCRPPSIPNYPAVCFAKISIAMPSTQTNSMKPSLPPTSAGSPANSTHRLA